MATVTKPTKNPDFTIVQDDQTAYHAHQIISKQLGTIGHVIVHPFWNCQIGVIANMCGILGLDKSVAIALIKDVWLQTTSGKAQVLVDINQRLEPKLEAIFDKKYINFKQQYTSTNGTKMVMYLIYINQWISETK